MARVIQVLDEEVANKIAAGEVIENPASVVKELVENSVDAGSTRIEVEIRDGGKEFIRVSDDGHGMCREDAALAFERHATSKIRRADDLFAIRTLGFRGEALPSIAAVSKVELTTRMWEDVIGTRILIEGGKIITIEDAGAPAGTTIVVRDLFYNTPARLKYLRGSAAEGRNVVDVVNQLILAHPAVSFLVVRDGEEVVKSSGNGKLIDSIVSVYGFKVAREMLTVGAGRGGFKISGYVGTPAVARRNRGYQRIIVNGRPVRNALIRNAVERAYDTLLPNGTFPAFLLVIQIDPQEVDVNVHPTKAEVRFADESLVFTSVLNAVRQALRSSELIPRAGAMVAERLEKERSSDDHPATGTEGFEGGRGPKKVEGIAGEGEEAGSHKAMVTPEERRLSLLPEGAEAQPEREAVKGDPTPRDVRDGGREGVDEIVKSLSGEESVDYEGTKMGEEEAVEAHEGALSPITMVSDGRRDYPSTGVLTTRAGRSFGEYRILGQLHRAYLIVERRDGLLLIDQHAAHERVIFESLRKRGEGGKGHEAQQLLSPVTMDLAPAEVDAFFQVLDTLRETGFDLECFGTRSFLVRAVPAFLRRLPLPDGLKEIVDELQDERAIRGGRVRREEGLYMLMACKAAIKAGEELHPGEMEALVEELLRARDPYTCPHGRPTMISFSLADLARLFKRT